MKDRKTHLAVEREIEIIGEAVRNMLAKTHLLLTPFLCFILVLSIPLFPSSAQHKGLYEKRAEKIGLKYVTDIPLPGGTSRFDYQTIDEVHQRLYISHMGANLVTVFDLNSRTIITNLRHIPRPTGIRVVPELDRLFVSASAKNEVYVFDDSSFKMIDKVPTGHFPDGIAFDPELKRVFISNEFGGIVTVFNALTNHVIANIAMGGEVGNTHYDPISKLIYSTVQTLREIVAINPGTLKIIARYHLPGCSGPHGFYIDSKDHYAFITGENNASYVVFDLTLKRIISRGHVGAGPDVLASDKKTHRLYVASESGVVSVFNLEKRKVEKIEESFLAKNAHSVSVDEQTHIVFFPLQDIGGHPVLLVMKPAQ